LFAEPEPFIAGRPLSVHPVFFTSGALAGGWNEALDQSIKMAICTHRHLQR